MLKITKLDNGLRVVTQNMPGLETVSMGIWNAVGGRDEVESNNGVAHLELGAPLEPGMRRELGGARRDEGAPERERGRAAHNTGL